MIAHVTIGNKELLRNIRHKQICLGGNKKLKIYGILKCRSGKRMKKENRVFFTNETDALANGYRPCGHCLPNAYKNWKKNNGPL